jgi:DNA-binding MarR family transcriptional regulator
MSAPQYRPPVTVSREDFLIDGSDADFRRSIYAMVQSVGRLLACRDAFGREMDLTPSQFAVLMGVAHCRQREGVSIKNLADHVGLASTHVTTEVGRLERAGYLIKKPSSADRRSVCIFLTPHAKNEIARVTPFIRLINDALFRDIDPASLSIAHRVARQLILNSERALAEVRRHNLESVDATPAFSSASAAVTSRTARRPGPGATRSAGRSEAVGSVRHRKAAAEPRSG